MKARLAISLELLEFAIAMASLAFFQVLCTDADREEIKQLIRANAAALDCMFRR